jgi:hypothetical protein
MITYKRGQAIGMDATLAFDGDRQVGFCRYEEKDPQSVRIALVEIVNEKYRRGIGTALLKQACEGYKHVTMSVLSQASFGMCCKALGKPTDVLGKIENLPFTWSGRSDEYSGSCELYFNFGALDNL